MEIKEELVRIITKDGATYVLGAPLPQPIGQDPEPVTVMNMELWVSEDEDSDDVFRIVSKANQGSHYENEGLSIVTTVPYSEATRWDAVVSAKEILDAINDARKKSLESDKNQETEEEEEEEEEEDENNNNNIDKNKTGDKNEQSKGLQTNKVG